MKFTDLARDLDTVRQAHSSVIEIAERAVTDLDRASDALLRLHTEAVSVADPAGRASAEATMWAECERRLGAHLNAARTALVREIIDYAQTLEAYHRASKRPLTPVH